MSAESITLNVGTGTKHVVFHRDGGGGILSATIMDGPAPVPTTKAAPARAMSVLPATVPDPPRDRLDRAVASMTTTQIRWLTYVLKAANCDFDFRESVNQHLTDEAARKVLVDMAEGYRLHQVAKARNRHFRRL